MSERVRALRDRILARFPESRLTPIAAAAAESLRVSHPGCPQDYLDVLQHLGHGTIGASQFALYGGPIESEEVFGSHVSLASVVLVGDDFAGSHVGYVVADGRWKLVEIEHLHPQQTSPSDAHDLVDYLDDWYGSGAS